MTGDGFAGKVAVVTGAGSGIGAELAVALARAGAKVAISDVNLAGLAATEERLKAIGCPARADRLDVSDRAAVLAYADEVRDHYGSVHQIYNNAGVAFFGEIENSEFGDFERVMNVNYWGVVNGTKAFLPHVIASGAGHIVNVSSIWGIFAVPGQSAYNSSKFAVRGFTEALRQEMKLAHHRVGVTAVYPSGVRTAIARTATGAQGLDVKELADLFDNKLAKGSPEAAARTILAGVRKNKAKVLVGPGARMFDVVVRATGSGYERIFGPLTGRMMPKMDTKV